MEISGVDTGNDKMKIAASGFQNQEFRTIQKELFCFCADTKINVQIMAIFGAFKGKQNRNSDKPADTGGGGMTIPSVEASVGTTFSPGAVLGTKVSFSDTFSWVEMFS